MGKDDPDIFFNIEKMNSEKTEADPDLEKSMPGVMEAAASECVKKHKGVTSKEPKDKKQGGYNFSGTLNSLAKEDKGSTTMLMCKLSMVLTAWPKKTLVSGNITKTLGYSIKADASDRELKSTAEELVGEATKQITNKVIDLVIDTKP
jgi:hypothetical protein